MIDKHRKRNLNELKAQASTGPHVHQAAPRVGPRWLQLGGSGQGFGRAWGRTHTRLFTQSKIQSRVQAEHPASRPPAAKLWSSPSAERVSRDTACPPAAPSDHLGNIRARSLMSPRVLCPGSVPSGPATENNVLAPKFSWTPEFRQTPPGLRSPRASSHPA